MKANNDVYFDSEYYYTNYKWRYNMLIMEIETLMNSLENEYSKYYMKLDAKRVINETFQFDGYVECLFDFGIISESDFNMFWEFTNQIRYDSNEILLSLDN